MPEPGGATQGRRAPGGTTLKLGVPPPHRAWWQQIWAKLLSPLPNCNAAAQTP